MTRPANTRVRNSRSVRNTLIALGVLLLLLTATAVRAQSPTDNGTPLGMAPGSPEGSYAISGFENVNLYNGGLSFSLPLLQIGGRGNAGYSVQLPVESKWIVQKEVWYDENNNEFTSLLPWSNPAFGASYGPGTISVKYSQWKGEGCYIGVQYFTTYRYASVSIVFTAPDGTEHELVDQATLGAPTSYPSCSLNGTFRGPIFVSRDQPGMTFIADAPIREAPYYANGRVTGYLKMPDGTVYRLDAIDHVYQWGTYSSLIISWVRDANGNKTTFGYTTNGYGDFISSIKDSLNHEVTIERGVTEAPYGLSDRLTYKGYGGAPRVIHISSDAMSTALRSGSTIQTYHQLFPELDGAEDPFDPPVVTAVWLPDSDGVTRKYRFLYNSYGELARVELPTGGAIEYDWTAGLTNSSNGLIYPVPGVAHWTEFDGTVPQIYRRLVTRRVRDLNNTLLGSTTYSRPESQNGDHSINNVGLVASAHIDASNQQLSVENHFFYGSPATSFFSGQATPQYMPTYSPFPSYRDGREYQTDYYAANGQTLLRREAQSWDQPNLVWWYGNPDAAPPNGPFVKETLTTLADSNQVMKTSNIHPQTGQIMIDQFGNPTDTWTYDYGSGAPGGLLRHLHTEFLTVNPVNQVDYTNRTSVSGPHMFNLPARMSIYDSGETERARTTMEYDAYSTATGHALLTDRPNISGLDASYTTGYTTRGNSTATTRYFLTNGAVSGSITGYSQYDIAGNSVKSIDARGNQTTFDFSDCFGAPDGNARVNSGATELNSVGQYAYAFPTVITNAMGHTVYTQYDYYLAKGVDSEDANGTTYSGFYSDAIDRPTKLISAANRDVSFQRQTLYVYDDVGRSVTQTADFNSFNETSPQKAQAFYDGLGRTTETRQFEGGSNYIAVRNGYDSLGRLNQVSNPFRNGETPRWTVTVFDELSRPSSVTTPDGAVATNSYSGNSATATDQTGKKKKSVTDALGRLTQVYEDPNGVNWLSNYTYDAQDNLISVSQYDPVSQHTQTRNFSYDSLKRLLSASNPENGAVTYVYDEQGNVLVQSDARGVSKHFSYDVLNRITRRWYNGSASPAQTGHNVPALASYVGLSEEANYAYDAQNLPAGAPPGFVRGSSTGKLVAVTYGTGASAGDYIGYDLVSRAVLKVQQTGGVNYQVSATYNIAGGRTSLTYPSGHVVNYNYDAAGRLADKDAQHLAMTGNLGEGLPRTYTQGILYSPLGGMTKEQFGTATPIYNKLFYNARGQLAEIRESTSYTGPTDTTWNRGAIINYYSNICWGMCGGTANPESAPDNNGNLKKQQVYIPLNDDLENAPYTSWWQRYDYDSVNRLQRVAEITVASVTLWQQEYAYDRWGNRTIHQNNTFGGDIPKPNFTVDPNTNQLAPPAGYTMSYDAVGNLMNDDFTGQGQRIFDAENRMTQAWFNGQWQTYLYDANGQRVRRTTNSSDTRHVYGFGGELLAEYAADAPSAPVQKEYGYRNGTLVVTAGAEGEVPAGWSNAVGVAINGNSLTKNGAGKSAWNGGAITEKGINSGDGYLEFTASETNKARRAGLGVGDTNQSWDDIDFCIFLDANGTVSINEGSALRGSFGSYASGDRFRVSVEGGVVKYRKNGTLLYTSTVAPTYPLIVDTSFFTLGSTITNVMVYATDLRWYVADQLGTPRLIFDQSGTRSGTTHHDYLPFGEELVYQGLRTAGLGYAADTIRQKFTSYERDAETGLDYAHARYYANTQGRFTGVDRISGAPPNPQSWNGYSYTLNNPLNLTDPTGLFVNAEYGTDPGRDSDPFLDDSRKRALYTEEMEAALAVYQHMVDQGLANLKLKAKQKKEEEAKRKKAEAECGCTLQIRGKAGKGLLSGNPLRFPSTSPTTLGPSATLPDRWGWQVEISGSVSGDVSGWHVSQNIEEHRVITYDSGYGTTETYDAGVRYDAESITGTQWASQPKGGNRFFALDAPGLPKLSNIISEHTVMNFTTFLSKGNLSRQIEWSVTLTVTNRHLTQANFYAHHTPVR